MAMSDEHHILKADLDGAAKALGVSLRREQHANEHGRTTRVITLELPEPTPVRARFVRESLLRRAKKLFVDEVEVGSAWFDDLIYVITSTRESTAQFLRERRVQQALIMLVDDDCCVEIEQQTVRLIDEDASPEGRDALAELLALATHLLSRAKS
jgi:hypothetical protein